MIFYEEPGVN